MKSNCHFEKQSVKTPLSLFLSAHFTLKALRTLLLRLKKTSSECLSNKKAYDPFGQKHMCVWNIIEQPLCCSNKQKISLCIRMIFSAYYFFCTLFFLYISCILWRLGKTATTTTATKTLQFSSCALLNSTHATTCVLHVTSSSSSSKI